MPSTRRSTVLGKRAHQEHAPSPAPSAKAEQLLTPDGTPHAKRPRTTVSLEGDDSNKENIPPLKDNTPNTPVSPRTARALRRTSTQVTITPRSRQGLRRSASTASLAPATPVAEQGEVKVNTPPPTPPTILQPIHVQVRALLRSACNNISTQVAGRDTERAAIIDFLASLDNASAMDEDEIPTSLFISGSPGTGKTALVHDVIRGLETTAKVVSINCMALKTVDALWDRMVEELSDLPKKKGSGKKLKGRDAVVSALTTLRVQCIVVLDELDHITPNAASLASIFSLSEKYSSLIRLVGIANTHTLTSNNPVATGTVKTVHFAPYTPAQLQEILQARLNPLSTDPEMAPRLKKLLPSPTLMLLTKKISALTGDVRSLFEVLRGAINMACTGTTSDEENPLNTPAPTVTPQHILAALKAYSPATARPSTAPTAAAPTNTNSETVTKIRNLGLQSRLALLMILLATNRLEAGLSLSSTQAPASPKPSASPMKRSASLPTTPSNTVGIETGALYSYYTGALSRTELGLFDAVSKSEFGDVLGMLEGVGLVTLSSSAAGIASVHSSPSKGRRAFSRTASFGPGVTRNSGGAGAVGEVKLVDGIWADEVLRGLGISAASSPASSNDENGVVDPKEEEVRGIWEREKTRLKRDVKAAAAAANAPIDVFAGAFEDD